MPRLVLWLVPTALLVLAAVERSEWIVALAVAAAFVARGIALNRPVVAAHVAAAAVTVGVAVAAHYSGHREIALLATALSGFMLVLPRASHAHPHMLPRIAQLVDRTPNDPLAPFVMHSSKSYFVNAAGSVAIGYRSRLGIAAVGGDPVGDPQDFAAAIAEFVLHCRAQGWRVAVLGSGERCRALWEAYGLRAVPIGRDVVIDIESFEMRGRSFRNLRQAVNRTRNSGLVTEVRVESELDADARAELMGIVDSAHAGRQERGFSMILDHLLDGRHPGMLVAVARDADGRAVAFQRYGQADEGRMITMDVPWRRPDAPNGVDERLTADMAAYARDRGSTQMSLAFAPFPELFAEQERSLAFKAAYIAVHLLDPLIAVESLYRFLRKFHALHDRRYAMLRLRDIGWVLIAFLTLEFMPHRKRP